MRKIFLALSILIFGPAFGLEAVTSSTAQRQSDKTGILRRAGKNKGKALNRQALTRAIDETLVIAEELALQLKNADPKDVEDVWASGKRDFDIDESEVSSAREACEALRAALDHESQASENDHEEAVAQRARARDLLRSHHKKTGENFVRDLRNWLRVGEGTLRRAREKREADK